MVPRFLSGGAAGNFRIATGVSVFFAVMSVGVLSWVFFEVLETGGLEGAMGEGAPGEGVVVLGFFAGVYVCLWVIAVGRGMKVSKGRG